MLANRTETLPNGKPKEALPQDCNEYYLFLLEFFVKHVSDNRLGRLNQMFCVPTSVHFSFLDFDDEDTLQVTPVDPLFQPQAGVDDDFQVFKSGKSVLFAVDRDSATDRNAKMILKITVKKRMPDGIKPDVLVGVSELDLSKEYAALRIETLQYWKKDVTISKVFEDVLDLQYNGKVSGHICVYVRISGYGQAIVTEFDAPTTKDPSTFTFSAGEIDRTLSYMCRKLDPDTIDLTEAFNEDLQDPTCPVCVPKRQLCIPCKKLGAIEERDKKTEYRRDDKMITERKLMNTPPKDRIQCRPGDSSEFCGKPVILKVSGLFDNDDSGKKPTVTVTDETAATDDSTDPDYDIFILRIGKKGLVGAGEKSDIQLEMKTPKGPERRPPIRYETRHMQTEHNEIIEPKDKKKKKKT